MEELLANTDNLGTQRPQRRTFDFRSLAWKLFGLVISLSITAYLLSQTNVGELRDAIRNGPIESLVAALAVYMMLALFRSLRFHILLDQRDRSFVALVPIVMYHNFLVRTLPFKTGEISYPILLQRQMKMPLQRAVSSLLGARLFELFMVALAGSIGLLLAAEQFAFQHELVLFLLAPGLVFFAGCLYSAGALLRLAGKVMRSAVERSSMARTHRLIEWVASKFDLLALEFDRMNQPRSFFPAILTSTLTFAMSVSFNILLLSAFGIKLNIGTLLVIVSVAMVVEAVPLATISGIGIIEGGWAFGFVLFAGFETSQASTIGFFLHGGQILAASLTGLAGFLLLQMGSNGQSPRAADAA